LKESDLGIVLALAGVGAAAFFLLRPRETATGNGASYTPIYGTGTALREPVPYSPAPATDEPGWLESFAAPILDIFKTAPSEPQSPEWWRAELQPLFRQQERAFSMPHRFLEAVADRESRFRDDIITCETLGGAGEEGIMQLKPRWHLSSRAERCNVKIAIPYAAKYLAKNYLRFGNSWEMALAAYNWGPTDLENYGFQASPAKTKEYIAWVRERADTFV